MISAGDPAAGGAAAMPRRCATWWSTAPGSARRRPRDCRRPGGPTLGARGRAAAAKAGLAMIFKSRPLDCSSLPRAARLSSAPTVSGTQRRPRTSTCCCAARSSGSRATRGTRSGLRRLARRFADQGFYAQAIAINNKICASTRAVAGDRRARRIDRGARNSDTGSRPQPRRLRPSAFAQMPATPAPPRFPMFAAPTGPATVH
jgi:hypothetical protein